MAESGSLTVYPSRISASAGNISTAGTGAVGKSSNNTSSSNRVQLTLSRNTETYLYVHFDLSSIPVGAEIQAVNCKLRFQLSSLFDSQTATLCSGDVAKSSSVNVPYSSSATLYELSGGTWTRDELLACRIKFYLYSSNSTGSSRRAYFYGADLIIQYTYQGERFLLKLGGKYNDIARVFKKVNGIWVEQTDLANVIKDGVRYQNGGEIESTGPTLITFSWLGTSCQAEEGMTWAEYMASSYNIGFSNGTTYIMTPDGYVLAYSDGTYVLPNDTIQSGHAYKNAR